MATTQDHLPPTTAAPNGDTNTFFEREAEWQARKNERLDRLKREKEQRMEEELKHCTFNPQQLSGQPKPVPKTNVSSTHERTNFDAAPGWRAMPMSSVLRSIMLNSGSQKDYQELKDCTFQPNVHR